MAGITGDDALWQHYNQVIFGHKHLATILSNVASTVVDDRVLDHDLLKMLRDLAAREVMMAKNWTLVRDGLLSKVVDNAVLLTIDILPEVEETDVHAALSRSYDTTSVANEKEQVKSDTNLQEDVCHADLPDTSEQGRILSEEERREICQELQQADKAYRNAKANCNAKKKLRLRQYRKTLGFKLSENNRLRRLEAHKSSEGVGTVTGPEEIAAKQTEILTMIASARQRRQGKAERQAAEATESSEKQRKDVWRKAQHEKRAQEDRERKERGTAGRLARQQRERKARFEARQLAKGDSSSLQIRQRLLPPMTCEEENFTIKEEVVEPWEI